MSGCWVEPTADAQNETSTWARQAGKFGECWAELTETTDGLADRQTGRARASCCCYDGKKKMLAASDSRGMLSAATAAPYVDDTSSFWTQKEAFFARK